METYFTEFTDYLAQLPQEIILWLAILGLLVFTLALCLGWLLGRRKTVRVRKQLELAQREKKQLQERLQTKEEEQKNLARELADFTTEKDDLLVQLQTTQSRNSELSHTLAAVRATNDQLQATNQSYSTTIEDLNDQVIGLKTRNEQLLDNRTGGGAAGAKDVPDLADRVAELERTIRQLSDPPQAKQRAVIINTGTPTHQVAVGEPYAPDEAGETTADTHQGTGDDLTQIATVGPFNQRKLNEAGITTYAQIAAWDDNDIADYAARIGYVAELIREENWVGQAHRLSEHA